MQPNFATLKPVGNPVGEQPNFANLKLGTMTPVDNNMISIGGVPIVGGIVGGALKSIGNFGSKAINYLTNTGNTVINQALNTRQDISNAGGGLGANLAGIAQMTGNLAGDTANLVIDPAIKAGVSLINHLNGDSGQTLANAGTQFLNQTNILGQKNSDTIAAVGQFVKNGVDNLPPNVVQSFGNFLNTVGLLGGGKIANAPVEDIYNTAKNLITKTPETVSNLFSGGKNLISNTIENTKNLITNKVGGKTAEQILATTEANVPKLTADEQKLWYRNQAQIANETAVKASQAANVASEQSITEVKNKIQNLNQQIGETSRATAITLKEPAKQVIKDASAKYVELTGEAANSSPALKKTMTTDNLSAAIDSKFEYNPDVGNALKSDLGLNEPIQKTVIDPQTKLPVIQAGSPPIKTLTNQQILDKAREIMAGVSKTAKTGGKTYSFAEYQAMQKYSFLMETLSNNGVDMTAANKFWREWAPIRDRIVREVKPFDETNVQKMPITNTLQKAAATAKTPAQISSKIDAQNFISELEKRMKLPQGTINSEVSDLVTGLEKAKLSKTNIEKVTDEVLAKIKVDKTEALKTMSLAKYNTLRQARINSLIKKVLIGAGIYVAAKVTGVDKAVLGAVKTVI